ncbi:hypothetical protein [Streptomyces palmae]|uniref:Peptidase n=1 Tax=Streptomyces palmae TaxID=1701085 RepID=A0A4Z0H978_9ACTN|nr:hypothetical protein [Streptomyces palmae]TGB13663.1 hypothetical protein E4099_09620 [Streptomyces palmae]
MRALRMAGAAAALCAALFAAAPAAQADSDPSAPTEAGTGFRTATEIEQGQTATASASNGDYLYWVFPAAAGQIPTVEATVKLPPAASRHGGTTWQLDVYDGLRRHQACTTGRQTRSAGQQDQSVSLRCTLRQVRPWSETWANDPLPGAYYVRLTVVDLPDQDLGLPIQAQVEAASRDAGGRYAEGGSVAPLNPRVRAGKVAAADSAAAGDEQSTTRATAVSEPEDGWDGGWFSDRWVWTVAGAVLGALAGVGGYVLTRHPRFTGRPPTGA